MAAAGRAGGGVRKGQSGDVLGFRYPGSHAGVRFGDAPLVSGPLDVVRAGLERRFAERGRDLRPGGASPEGIVDLDGMPEMAGQVLAEGQQLQALEDGQRLGCGAALAAAALWPRPGGSFREQVPACEQLISHQRLGAGYGPGLRVSNRAVRRIAGVHAARAFLRAFGLPRSTPAQTPYTWLV